MGEMDQSFRLRVAAHIKAIGDAPNGFEAWRRLCELCQRSSELLKAQAAELVMTPILPDPKKLDDIADKLDKWDTDIIEVYNKHK